MRRVTGIVVVVLLLLSAWLLWRAEQTAEPLVGAHPGLQVLRGQDDLGDYWLIRLADTDSRRRWQGQGAGYRLRIDRLGPQLYNLDVRVVEERRDQLQSWHIESTVQLGPGRTVVAGRAALTDAAILPGASRIIVELPTTEAVGASGFFSADR